MHLKVADTHICATRCAQEFGNPCTRFCPAQRVRDGRRWRRRQATAGERGQLRALQGLRHQGPVRCDHLDHAGRRQRSELPRTCEHARAKNPNADLKSTGRLAALRVALNEGAVRSAERMINTLHPAEIAQLLESLPPEPARDRLGTHRSGARRRRAGRAQPTRCAASSSARWTRTNSLPPPKTGGRRSRRPASRTCPRPSRSSCCATWTSRIASGCRACCRGPRTAPAA